MESAKKDWSEMKKNTISEDGLIKPSINAMLLRLSCQEISRSREIRVHLYVVQCIVLGSSSTTSRQKNEKRGKEEAELGRDDEAKLCLIYSDFFSG